MACKKKKKKQSQSSNKRRELLGSQNDVVLSNVLRQLHEVVRTTLPSTDRKACISGEPQLCVVFRVLMLHLVCQHQMMDWYSPEIGSCQLGTTDHQTSGKWGDGTQNFFLIITW